MPDATSTQDVAVAASNAGGRPTVKTPENRALIIAEVREGTPKSCQSIVGRSTLAEWENEDAALTDEIDAAEQAWVDERRRAIQNNSHPIGGHDWRADAWLLERRARKLYGKPEAAKDGAGGTHVTVNNFVTINEAERTEFQMRERAALEALNCGRN